MALFRRGSRYTNSTFSLGPDNNEFLLLRKIISIPKSGQDVYITVEERFLKRPDIISQITYGRPDLWWVIFDINDIRQPLFDLKIGQLLRIPPLGLVLESIEKLNK
jgi:hypothetical protein